MMKLELLTRCLFPCRAQLEALPICSNAVCATDWVSQPVEAGHLERLCRAAEGGGGPIPEGGVEEAAAVQGGEGVAVGAGAWQQHWLAAGGHYRH